MNSPAALIRNDTLSNSKQMLERSDSEYHWLQIGLVAQKPNRSAIGSVITLERMGKLCVDLRKVAAAICPLARYELSFGLGEVSHSYQVNCGLAIMKNNNAKQRCSGQKLLIVEPSMNKLL